MFDVYIEKIEKNKCKYSLCLTTDNIFKLLLYYKEFYIFPYLGEY